MRWVMQSGCAYPLLDRTPDELLPLDAPRYRHTGVLVYWAKVQVRPLTHVQLHAVHATHRLTVKYRRVSSLQT